MVNGVRVMLVTGCPTVIVYSSVFGAKSSTKTPGEGVSRKRVASFDARFTVTDTVFVATPSGDVTAIERGFRPMLRWKSPEATLDVVEYVTEVLD